ncbi:MAG: proton-conducting transporter membrane subunit, partial [Granulosicoccaceae bacterium]
KITLFFCAGAIYVHTHKTNISQLNGLGRKMPFTFGAFFVAALCIIGLPPLGGAWSKWFLITASFDTQHWIMAGALILSSLLNIAYLLPIVANGFFKPSADGDDSFHIDEAPLLMLIPLCITASFCLLAFIFGDAIYGFVQLIPLR